MYRLILTLIALVSMPVATATALTLYDRNNKAIGQIVETEKGFGGTGVWVAAFRGDATYLLRVDQTAIEASHVLEYASDDCTGTQMGIYLYPGENARSIFWASAIGRPGNTLYMQRRAAAPVTMTTRSWWDPLTQACYPIADPAEVTIHQVMPIHDLSQQYQPPYRINPRLEQAR